MQVDFRGCPPTVAFIQVPNGFFVTYAGIALFEMAGDAVIREIARRENRDPSIYAPGRHQYYFPDLNMTLWRSVDFSHVLVFSSERLSLPFRVAATGHASDLPRR
jgi:hypothetical protein